MMRRLLLLVMSGTAAILFPSVSHAQPNAAPDREITRLSGDLYDARESQQHTIFLVTPAGIVISGQGRGCSMTGWFEVREINTTPSGDLTRFDATFEQRCSGSASTLRGEIRFVR